ncbi:thermonuclease family protein [Agrobacterium larrymoorei]|uniref:thermonuclease family protein n=1 Tax=Agrobacterium larrymoorei TaxID=160699 RepID=UPI0030BEE2E4
MIWVTFIAALALALPNIATAAEITGRASVIDGDTIEINGTRIRFNGIDAPESNQLCQNASGKAYRCGQASAKALDAFLSQSRPTTCVPTGKSYDRLVGHCVRADGSDVNTWMVRNGYAIDWPKYSHGFYAETQQEAQLAKAGIWSGSFQMPCVVRGSLCD